jgi:hypothetical protein
VLRAYRSTDEVFTPDPASATIPLYWYRPALTLGTTPGMHRFTWDVHYQPVDGVNRVGGPTLPIAAIGRNTVPVPTTPWANPGAYTVRLTVNGTSYTQPIVVRQDPRVKTPALAMAQVYQLSKATYDEAVAAQAAVQQAADLRAQIAKVQPQASGPASDALATFDRALTAIAGAAPAGGGRGRGQGPGGGRGGRGGGAPAATQPTLSTAAASLAGVMNSLQAADVPATTVQLATLASTRAAAAKVMAGWQRLLAVDLASLNGALTAARLTPIKP